MPQNYREPLTNIFFLRFRNLLLLLALSLLVIAKGEAAEDRLVCSKDFLQIVSPDQLSVDQCRQVAKMTMDAWKFDLKQMNWDSSTTMDAPLTMRVLSIERMKAEHKGSLGFARSNGKLFVTSARLLDDDSANRTLAHELGHIQTFRTLGRHSLKVPVYFLEGHGLSMGGAYRDHLGLSSNKNDTRKARQIASLTANEAKLILTTNKNYYISDGKKDRKKEDMMESMGIFFVEYLHVRGGIPNAVERMGQVFELVGRGKTYESAFKQAYGISLDKIISELTAFMEQTASDPAERLKETRYEGLLDLKTKKAARHQ